jgi:hypothetical protein
MEKRTEKGMDMEMDICMGSATLATLRSYSENRHFTVKTLSELGRLLWTWEASRASESESRLVWVKNVFELGRPPCAWETILRNCISGFVSVSHVYPQGPIDLTNNPKAARLTAIYRNDRNPGKTGLAAQIDRHHCTQTVYCFIVSARLQGRRCHLGASLSSQAKKGGGESNGKGTLYTNTNWCDMV